jgi:hypothetical protein
MIRKVFDRPLFVAMIPQKLFHKYQNTFMKKPGLLPLIIASLFGLILTATPPAGAASYTWINNAGGNWNVAANWSPNGVPGFSDSAAITTTGSYTVTVDDSESIGTLTLGASTADTTVQTLNVSGGTLTVNNASTGTAQGTLSVSGGGLAGAGALTLAGPLNWTGGTIMGTVQFNGGSVNGGLNLDGALVNSGTLAWNGSLYLFGGVLTNLGTINMAAGTSATSENGLPDLDNDGQFNVSGSGTSTIGIPFNNHGMVAVNGGTLDLADSGTESNSFTVAAGATLELGGGTFTFNSGSTNSGAGSFTVNGATVNFSGSANVTSVLNLSGGTLNLNGSNRITPSAVNVSGGTEEGSQTLQVTNSGGFAWTGGTIMGTVQFNGGSVNGGLNLDGALVNSGTLAWSGALNMYGGVLTNLGTINLAAGTSVSSENGLPDLDNDGQFNVSGPGTSTIGIPFNNNGTVAVNGGTLDLSDSGTEGNSFTVASGATLELGGGTFTFDSDSSVSGAGSFMVNGGTVNFSGSANVTSGLNLPGGILNVNGSNPITPATATISGGTEEGIQPVQVQNAGGFAWTGGSIMGTVQFNGGSVTGGLNLNGALVNSGTLAWSGNLFMYGGVLTNLGTINLAAGTSVSSENGLPDLDNDGQFNVSGPGTSFIGIPFNNYGTVAVNGGTLELAGGGTESDSFTVAFGATLNVGGGTVTFNSGSTISGAGNFTVTGGTAGLGGKCNVTGANTFSAGVANVTGACTITGTLVISGGTLNLNGSGTITPTSATISGGSEGGSQPMQVPSAGGFAWTGGSIVGTVQFNGGSVNGGLNLYGALVNSGTLAWSGALYMYGGVLTNLGTINLAAGTGASSENGLPDLDNDGQFNVSGPGTSTIEIPFNNHGTVAVNGGTLDLEDYGTESGPFTLASGTTLHLGNGTFTFNSGSTVSGAGSFTVGGGPANFSGSANVTSVLNLSSGTLNLNGSNPITPASATISGGTEEGTQPMQVQNAGDFIWTAGSIMGTIQFNGGSVTGGLNLYGALVNSGTLAWNGTLYMFGGVLTNLGTINLTAGSGATSENGLPDLDNNGQFNVSGPGTSTIGIPLNNTGTLNIQSGTLSVTGGYTSTNGTLNFGISSTTNFGTLTLSGPVALNGTLDAIANGYTPKTGDTFPLITYGSESGNFGVFNLPSDVDWHTSYDPTVFSLIVSAVNAPFLTLQAVTPFEITSGFTMLMLGPIGSNYTIEGATDSRLNNWVGLTNFTTVDTSFYYTDTTATNYPVRIFRAVMH